MVIRFQDDIDIYEIHVYSIISAIDKNIVWSSQSERRVSNSYNIISRILQYELCNVMIFMLEDWMKITVKWEQVDFWKCWKLF